MYGQLNCWVLPKGMYGAFRGPNGTIYVMAQRSARNLSWQDKLPKQGEPECLLQVSGQDLLGTKLQVRLSLLPRAGEGSQGLLLHRWQQCVCVMAPRAF